MRKLALKLPGVADGTSDGTTLVVRVDFPVREALMQVRPGVFHVTDHYLNHPAILVRLPRVSPAKLRQVLEHAGRVVAPARLRKNAAM